jgi:hypothetical protein
MELVRPGPLRIGVALGAGAAGAAVQKLPVGQVEIIRVPVDLDGYVAVRVGRAEVLVDAGLAASLLRVHGRGFEPDLTTSALEWSVRLGASVRLWVTPRLAVTVGLDAFVVPETFSLMVPQAGTLGGTPGLWLDVTLGLCAQIN